MIIRQTKTRYTTGPPSSRSLGCSFHPRVRSSHPRHSSPSFHLRGCRESFRRSSFSQTARNRSALRRRITGNTISSASSTGARTRDIYFPYPGFFFSLAFSRRFPVPLSPRPRVVICSRWIFQFLNIEVIEIASFSFLSAALPLRSFVIPIPEVILPNFDSRRGSIVEHAPAELRNKVIEKTENSFRERESAKGSPRVCVCVCVSVLLRSAGSAIDKDQQRQVRSGERAHIADIERIWRISI